MRPDRSAPLCQHSDHSLGDEFDPIPWFTQQHVRDSVERMKAWAAQSHLALVDQLSDEQWENLARMALDMRVRGPE